MSTLSRLKFIIALGFILPFSMSVIAQNAKSEKKQDESESKEVAVQKAPKAVSTGDKIYTWIDSRGNRIYSDVPRKGAKEMQIEKGTDFDGSAIKVKKPNAIIKSLENNKKSYQQFSIVSPPQDATIRNNQGSFQVALSMNPALFPGDRTTLTIDGKPVPGNGSSLYQLNNVDRGTHTLVASIISKTGKKLLSSQPVTIHMHRGSR